MKEFVNIVDYLEQKIESSNATNITEYFIQKHTKEATPEQRAAAVDMLCDKRLIHLCNRVFRYGPKTECVECASRDDAYYGEDF